MTGMKSALLKGALITTVAAAALAASVSAASAAVVCNRYHECWTVKDHYTGYPNNLRIMYHDDAWRAAHVHGYRWRSDQTDDHGYYRNGVWIAFPR